MKEKSEDIQKTGVRKTGVRVKYYCLTRLGADSRFFIRLSIASPGPGLCARRVARIKLGHVVHSRLHIDPPEMIERPLRCPACPHPYRVEKQARRSLPAILRCTRRRSCNLRHQRFAARSQPGLSRLRPGTEQRSPVAITLG